MACRFGNPFGTVCCFECKKECEDRCKGMPKEFKECEYYYDGEHEDCINGEELIDNKELTNTKNCKDCFYSVRNLCYVDGHDVNDDPYRAYSCKYYKYCEANRHQK